MKELYRYYISDCYEIDDLAVGNDREKLYLGGDWGGSELGRNIFDHHFFY